MTTKGLRYERFECDICHRKQKLELEAQEDGSYLFDGIGNYTMTVRLTDMPLATPTKKPEPEKIEMCQDCNSSFNKWRRMRQGEDE